MFPAARIGDTVTHDSIAPSGAILPPLVPPVASPVIIEGLPAAYMTCTVLCTGATSAGMPAHPPPPPGVPPVPIIMGSPTVFINGFPAARWMPSGDTAACGAFLGDPKLAATRTVLIGNGSSAGAPGPAALGGGGGGGGAGAAAAAAAEASAPAAAAAAASSAASAAASPAAAAASAAASAASSAASAAPQPPAGPPTSPERLALRQNVLNDIAQADVAPAAPAAPAAPSNISVPADPAVQSGNPELMAKYEELRQIGEDLRQNGFTPKPDEEVLAAVKRGDFDNPRFVISLQASQAHEQPLAFKRPDTGRMSLWTAPFDAMKAGDLSPALLCALTGTEFKPDTKYEMFIVDREAPPPNVGTSSYSFVPTFEQMEKYGPDELHADAPNDPIHDKELLKQAVAKDYQPEYKAIMDGPARAAKLAEFRPSDVKEFVGDQVASGAMTPDGAQLFRSRHLYRTQLGCNRWWRGDGTTEFLSSPANVAAVAKDGIRINQMPGEVGVPEFLTIERNPPSIADLEANNSVLTIPLGNPAPTTSIA